MNCCFAESIQQNDIVLSIFCICKIDGVTRSVFYAWMDAAPVRQRREICNQADFELMLEAYRFSSYTKGARSI